MPEEHGRVHQNLSAARLFNGEFGGSSTAGEEFTGSSLGLGVMANLDGEVVSLDGDVFAVPVDGHPRQVKPEERVAFAISARSGTEYRPALPAGQLNNQTLLQLVDELISEHHDDADTVVAAIRLHARMSRILMRTVAPHGAGTETLAEVLAHEKRFDFTQWSGTLVGFRFPDRHHAKTNPSVEAVDGKVISGLHLHGLADELTSGGHVHEFELDAGQDETVELVITIDTLDAI
jgi:acetolactate decarboxylase